MKITKEFKDKVIEAMLNARNNYEGSDAAFAKTMAISAAIFSRLKNGETERLLSDAEWIDKGRRLNVQVHSDNWKTARTEVYQQIEESFHHCQRTQSSMVLVDDCGIGKTPVSYTHLDVYKRQGKERNQNALKMTDEMISLLNDLFAGQDYKPTRTDVFDKYNGFPVSYTHLDVYKRQKLP